LVIGAVIVALAGGTWFVVRMQYVADPLVPLSLLARRAFTVTNLQTVVL
jgi:hypothetical protein